MKLKNRIIQDYNKLMYSKKSMDKKGLLDKLINSLVT